MVFLEIAWRLLIEGPWLPRIGVALGVVGVPVVLRIFAALPWSRACFALAAAAAGPAHLSNFVLERRLDAFDLDGDGIFAGQDCDPKRANPACEATPLQDRAMRPWAGGIGRALAIWTAVFVAPIAGVAAAGVAALLDRSR